MTAKDKIDLRELAANVIEGQSEDLAVGMVQTCCLAVGDDLRRIGRKDPELVRMQPAAFPKFKTLSMRDLGNVVSLYRSQVSNHPCSRDLWH